MVSSQQKEILWMFDFICQKQAYAFDRLFSSIDIITQEKVIGVTWKSTVFEQLEQIWKLAVNITTYFDRCFEFQQHRLRQKYLLRFKAETSNFGFHELAFFTLCINKLIDYGINIDFLVLHMENNLNIIKLNYWHQFKTFDHRLIKYFRFYKQKNYFEKAEVGQKRLKLHDYEICENKIIFNKQLKMNRVVDYENLKMQNFQLKNQITDLKNAFDLNRDVLKILSEQAREKHPQSHIFYQIISRLTGINNQIMLTNIEILQQKNKLIGQNKKMQNTIIDLSQRIEEIIKNTDCVNPKQIHMQMREEMKELRSQILALNEDCLRKKFQISRLQKIIKQKQLAEQKKPIIPSIKDPEIFQKINEKQMENISKKFETQGKISKAIMDKNLERENRHLKRLVQELQYRLTLLSRIYEVQPLNDRDQPHQYEANEELNFRSVTQNQLKLLMFALNNTRLQEDSESNAVKVTVTNRFKQFMGNQKTVTRVGSSIF